MIFVTKRLNGAMQMLIAALVGAILLNLVPLPSAVEFVLAIPMALLAGIGLYSSLEKNNPMSIRGAANVCLATLLIIGTTFSFVLEGRVPSILLFVVLGGCIQFVQHIRGR